MRDGQKRHEPDYQSAGRHAELGIYAQFANVGAFRVRRLSGFLMGNPNPSPATRFGPGNKASNGRPLGSRNKAVIARELGSIRSLAEVKAMEGAFQGRAKEFLEAAMRNPQLDHTVRLAAAGALLRETKDDAPDDKMTSRERRERILELIQKLQYADNRSAALEAQGRRTPPVITVDAEPSPVPSHNAEQDKPASLPLMVDPVPTRDPARSHLFEMRDQAKHLVEHGFDEEIRRRASVILASIDARLAAAER
jgi:hypothetical protein